MVDNNWLSSLIAGKIKIIKKREKQNVITRKQMREQMHVLPKNQQDFIKKYLAYERNYIVSSLRNWKSIKDMLKIIDDEADEFSIEKAEAIIKIEKWFAE